MAAGNEIQILGKSGLKEMDILFVLKANFEFVFSSKATVRNVEGNKNKTDLLRACLSLLKVQGLDWQKRPKILTNPRRQEDPSVLTFKLA